MSGTATTPKAVTADAPGPRPPRHVTALRRALPVRSRTHAALRRFALWSVITNVVIVITGGVVRLTDSGLGCPTWPKCTDATLTPTAAYSYHGIIEFGNRQLTFVVAFFAVATWLVALARREQRLLAWLAALSIPAQAVLGGITVRTHLNPWAVGAHFMLSMAVLFVTFWLWWRVRDHAPRVAVPRPALQLARLTAFAALVVLALGTIVTGAGPHAGSADVDGTVHRNGLKVSSMAQLHADSVWILVGLSIGLLVLTHALRSERVVRRAAWLLVAIEAAQGVIGYMQYFLHVPPLLVGFHIAGACLVWLTALNVLALVEPRASASTSAAA